MQRNANLISWGWLVLLKDMYIGTVAILAQGKPSG